MKLYKLHGEDAETIWFGSLTEAKSYRFKNQRKKDPVDAVEVPTKKAELIAWLNAHGL